MDDFAKKQAEAYDRMAFGYAIQKFAHNPAIPDLKIFRGYLGDKALILDIGCGVGSDAQFLASTGCHVLGIDLSEAMIAEAKRRVGGVEFQKADFRESNFPAAAFEGVWCSTVFHHVQLKDQQDFVAKCHGILKPAGVMYISTKRSGTNDNNEGWVKEHFGAEPGEQGGIEVERFVKKLSDETFKQLLEAAGFEIVRFKIWGNKTWMDIFAKKKG